MAATDIYQTFKRANCWSLSMHGELRLSKSTVLKVRDCFAGKRQKLPYWFGMVYPGEGREKVGASAVLRRIRQDKLGIDLSWFLTTTEPPAQFGKLGDLFNCIQTAFTEKEVVVYAHFSYDIQKVGSVFKPIQIPERPTIFDEIIGFTGIKRDPGGKLVYQLQVSFEKERFSHVVTFSQKVKLTEDLPLSLVETASKISTFALKPRVET